MISLISTSFKVETNYTRLIEYIIENYFNCIYNYIVDDNYFKKSNNTFYKEYVVNSYNELEYFDFTQKVNLLFLKDLPEIDKDKISWDGLICYVDLPYIFSLLTKQDISFYEIDISTYLGKKTTILSNGKLVSVNLILSESNAP
jgi:hypothetical protein